ncbi:MAG: hypothetical protein KIT15_03470 [Xanthobacteraceae bacterium]|nr:hypothetical protein [Xanthobacteraceae bacterium]
MIARIVAAFGMLALFAGGAAAQNPSEDDRRELMTLYFALIAADRCDFHLDEAEADKLIQAATALQKKLGLKDDAADVLYEQVETNFEKTLPDACKKDGEAFKAYQQVMERIRKN